MDSNQNQSFSWSSDDPFEVVLRRSFERIPSFEEEFFLSRKRRFTRDRINDQISSVISFFRQNTIFFFYELRQNFNTLLPIFDHFFLVQGGKKNDISIKQIKQQLLFAREDNALPTQTNS